jgi:hypothetical protein
MLGIMPTTEGVCPFGDHRFEYELKPGQRPVYCSPQHAWKASAQRQKARKAGLERRVCGRCKKEKPREQFGGPTNPYCRPCHTEYERERRQLNGQQNPGYTRALNLRRYGLTLQQVEIMLASQNGRCAICRTDAPGGQGWHVDHDHSCCNTRKKSCGRCTRGLLCSRCNIAIGNLRDDPVIIQAALDYVRLHHDRIACIPPAASRATQPLPRKFTKDVT